MNIGRLFGISEFNPRTTSMDGDIGITGNQISDEAKVRDPIFLYNKPSYYNYTRRNNSVRNPNGVQFYRAEYDLPTIANAIQLDGLLNRSVNIFVEQILKNDFEVVSKTDKAQKHTRARIREIELMTNIKFYETIETAARQLVTYGNAYIIKVRRNSSKLGKPYKLFNRTVKPIVGLFVAEATSMQVGVNSLGKVSHYKQMVNGEESIYQVDDVIHLTYNKIPGTLTGLSNIHMVLDDIRALRKLEEEIEILGYQYAIPLYLYKVGTDNHPAAPGEVEAVSNTVNHMPTYGIMVTPHTHTMESVTSDADPIDIMKFVEHFKRRAYTGLGISPVSMGETDTSNRNTSEVLDIAMQAITKSFQTILKNKIDQELFKEFIMDAGMSPAKVDVSMRFPEIDLEAQIKKETHILQKYQGNLITRTEARLEANYDAKIDEEDTYLTDVQIPLAQAEAGIQAEADIKVVKEQGKVQEKIARIGAAAKAASSSSVSTKTSGRSKSNGTKAKKASTASQNKVSSNSKPTNQHGTSLGRPKISRDHIDDMINFTTGLSDILLLDEGYTSNLNLDTYTNKVKIKIKSSINQYMKYTTNDMLEYYHRKDLKLPKEIEDDIYKYVDMLVDQKINRLKNIPVNELSDNKIRYTIGALVDEIDCTDKIDNYIKSFILKESGYSTILYNSDDCSLHSDTNVNVSDISINNVPPLRRGCTCKIEDHNAVQ